MLYTIVILPKKISFFHKQEKKLVFVKKRIIGVDMHPKKPGKIGTKITLIVYRHHVCHVQ